jgi:nitrogenase molybdenum-cofactor synthesis protein NifE
VRESADGTWDINVSLREINMITDTNRLMEDGCSSGKRNKVCKSRGGESCAFDGAMIVLQPIADTAHIVHGPAACCGNSWEGRGTLSRVSTPLHKMGFTTDMCEMDIVYGAERKLYDAIIKAQEAVNPKAIFVHATCVSGLIGEDIDAVCRKTGKKLGIPVIPVNAPGFIGPKNLGNRIAGEALLDYVIGSGEPSVLTDYDVNLIGEYNIAGDLWLVEPLLKEAGIRILSRITGDATFEEITYAHRAKLNVLVCSRALINVAKEMERRYGIPYVEVSFFGKTEMSKALRLIADVFRDTPSYYDLAERIESIIGREEKRLEEALKTYDHLRGKKAVLYSGGVKSWSFISALADLGIETVAVGTKKSTLEDEEKMKEIMGEDAPLVQDVSPAVLLRLLRENRADILVAGGRNQYLAIKEGYPFVDVNQERHTAYAGYEGLLNLAGQISNGIEFYSRQSAVIGHEIRSNALPAPHKEIQERAPADLKKNGDRRSQNKDCVINPLKHSQSIGAAIAFQGIHKAIPVIHAAQGCTFLGKVLLTKHFREPVALAGTKLFAEDVIMGSEENILKVVEGIAGKNSPDVIALLTSGLSEVKGDDMSEIVKKLRQESDARVLYTSTPDYEGGLETGYARAVEAMVDLADERNKSGGPRSFPGQINVLAGSHLTPADFSELREIVESFGLSPIILPDLSALDGSRQGISPLAIGGTAVDEIGVIGLSEFTIALGSSMEGPASRLKEEFGIDYKVFESIAGMEGANSLMETLSSLSGNKVPAKFERQRRILRDTMRDAHFYFVGKRVCIALEPDLAFQTAVWLAEMGAAVTNVVIPQQSKNVPVFPALNVTVGDLFSIEGDYDLLISNSHAEDTAERLKVPLYQAGFPVYKVFGYTARVTIGYSGTVSVINEVANMLMSKGKDVRHVEVRAA